jgi:hypothetical protein
LTGNFGGFDPSRYPAGQNPANWTRAELVKLRRHISTGIKGRRAETFSDRTGCLKQAARELCQEQSVSFGTCGQSRLASGKSRSARLLLRLPSANHLVNSASNLCALLFDIIAD